MMQLTPRFSSFLVAASGRPISIYEGFLTEDRKLNQPSYLRTPQTTRLSQAQKDSEEIRSVGIEKASLPKQLVTVLEQATGQSLFSYLETDIDYDPKVVEMITGPRPQVGILDVGTKKTTVESDSYNWPSAIFTRQNEDPILIQ